MRIRVDFQESIILPGGGSFRYGDGVYDEATGILWLDEMQGATPVSPGRKIRAGMGVHLASKASVLKLDQPEAKAAKAKPEAKPAA